MTLNISQSLAHGLEVLLLYDTSTPFLTVSQISKRLGYSRSKSYRMVRTLIKYNLLSENPGTNQYSLGLNILRLGLAAQRKINISVAARPFMEELALLTQETVTLTAVNGTRGVVLGNVESEQPIRYSVFHPGASVPLHCGASSKILMAYLSENLWDHIIAREGLIRHTANTITDADQLKDHLREIRKNGYAFSNQEIEQDVMAVSAPILNGLGELVAGLSVAGPAFRFKKKLTKFRHLVIKYAQKISSHICGDGR